MASGFCLLPHLGLSPCVVKNNLGISAPEVWHETQYRSSSSLQKWLSLLPRQILDHLDKAFGQEIPFMPPTFTPELLSSPNEKLPGMNQIQIICHCVDLAMKEEDYNMASALIFLVDRACYRFGYSRPVLRMVDEIMSRSPDTPMAPQVVLRKARVMKDTGDLNGATRILNKIINKEYKWTYQSAEQEDDTKAACWHVEGQLYHNMGLWRKAVTPLVEALHLFRKVGDDKGIASCLDVLSRCLSRISYQEYEDVRRCHKDIFRSEHPYYEAYLQATEAVNRVQHITAGFFSSKHQLVADESLLKYASLQTVPQRHRLLEKILQEIKIILAGYQHLTFLRSVESFFGFVRTLFTVSLVLQCSSSPEDKEAASMLEEVSIDLFHFMCCEISGQDLSGETPSELKQTWKSVQRINTALKFLGLPLLEESEVGETRQPEEQNGGGAVAGEQDERGAGVRPLVSIDRGQIKEMPDDDLHKSSQTQSIQVKSTLVESSQPRAVQSSPVDPSQAQSSLVESSQVHGDDRSALSVADGFSGSSCHRKNVSKTLDAYTSSEIRPEFLEVVTCHRPEAMAATFPAAAGGGNHHSKYRGEKHDSTSILVPFVGVPLSGQQLLSAVCPSLTPEASESLEAYDSEDSGIYMDKCDEQSESLMSLSSASSGGSFCEDYCQLADLFSFLDSSLSSKLSTPVERKRDSACQKTDAPNLERPATEVCQSQRTYTTCEQVSKVSGCVFLASSSTVNLEATTKATPDADETVEPRALTSSFENWDSLNEPDNSATWIPQADRKVHKAVLWSFNPETFEWFAQTTVAYLGLELRTERKGAFRDAFYVSFIHQDEPLGRYVGKRYRNHQRRPSTYMADVLCQTVPGCLVNLFNQALTNCPHDFLRIQFLPVYHLQMYVSSGVFDWLNLEPFLHGSFVKLTSNHRYVSSDSEVRRGTVVGTAFTHFSFVRTRGLLMVVDLQGWVPTDDRGMIYLTDPVWHTRLGKPFNSGDRQEQGMKEFWKDVHPHCNEICQFLGIDRQRPTH